MGGQRSLGRYRLVRPLGSGGMGEVYLATSCGAAGFEKLVALKLMHDESVSRVRTEGLWREALLGARLDHENLVGVLDLGEEDDRYYLVLEYVRGFSLAHVLEHLRAHDEELPLRFAVHAARAVARALAYMHRFQTDEQRPLIHGDVSASNVLLSNDGRIKLSDLGLAALASEGQSGKVAGKPEYLPREAFTGATHRQSWDLYALGLTLYRALAGRSPFPERSVHRLLDAKAEAVQPVREVRPEVPVALAAVVERALAVAPEDRFATAEELLDALDEAYPRQADDHEAFAGFIAALYERSSFIAEMGELPSSTVTGSGLFAPEVEVTEAVTVDDVRTLPTLRLGLSPAMGPELARSAGERLARVLGHRLRRTVRSIVLGDYQSLVDSIVSGDIDIAWMPPAAYLEAAEHGVDVLAMARRPGGRSFESAIVVAADAPIDDIEALRGRAIAWVDRQSTSGYVVPRAHVAATCGDPDAFFGAEHFHGSHRAACQAVLNGWADAAATFATRDREDTVVGGGWIDLLERGHERLRPIAFAGPIPSDNIAHRAGLPDKLVAELRRVLLDVGATPDERDVLRDVFNAEGFAPAGPEADARLRAVLGRPAASRARTGS